MGLNRGLVQVYTGNGKGKTTASIGLAMRAVGAGFRVLMVQFIKGVRKTGELETAALLYPKFRIVPAGKGFVHLGSRSESSPADSAEAAMSALVFAWECMESGEYDVIILDEVNCALSLGLIPVNEIVRMIEMKPKDVELVLTGRGAAPRILEAADLVTEMREVKHPFRNGIAARRGIEF
jgi:cob(I)alamin adenosyltransferase